MLSVALYNLDINHVTSNISSGIWCVALYILISSIRHALCIVWHCKLDLCYNASLGWYPKSIDASVYLSENVSGYELWICIHYNISTCNNQYSNWFERTIFTQSGVWRRCLHNLLIIITMPKFLECILDQRRWRGKIQWVMLIYCHFIAMYYSVSFGKKLN